MKHRPRDDREQHHVSPRAQRQPDSLPLAIVRMKMLYGVDSVPLLAVPLFMLAGELMSVGGIMTRIVRFATALVGWITGGLAHVNIVVNMIMAGMSGSAVADVAATGSILIPAWCASASPARSPRRSRQQPATIGPIIPPSIPFVLIGSIAQVSIGRLFLGGAIPGILMAFSSWGPPTGGEATMGMARAFGQPCASCGADILGRGPGACSCQPS